MKKYWKYGLIGLIIFIFLLVVLFYPRLKLKKNDVEIKVNDKYEEPGYKAYNIFKSYHKKVKIKSNLNTKKIGEYKIKYSYKYLFFKKQKTRIVKVVDKEKPTIKIEFDEEKICPSKYKEYKYSAEDNYDGDLTDKVKVTLKDNKLIYKVKDSSNNERVVTKKVELKTDSELELKLKGSEKITLYLGTKYEEPGYKAKDECDGDLTDKVKVEGKVDKDKEGTYKIKYTVFNSNEKKETKTRTVVVMKKPKVVRATASNGGGKVIFLTFDDGPGYYTKSILDTLDKYGVKATFFVTNQFPSYQYLITEESKRGHVVAVHTYSHNYNVYSSVEAYITDFNKMNDIIRNRTGSTSNLFRFPGGSSNTVSAKYSKGVVTKIAAEMQAKGYVYFDWHISSGDAAGYSADRIYNAVINGASRCGGGCVVLMHDIKGTTAKALDPILAELKRNNYTFGTLSEAGPTAHHKINN